MTLIPRIILPAAIVLIVLACPVFAQEVDPSMDKADYPLEQVTLGRQVWGPKINRQDLENRVVLIYTWGIT